MGFVKNTDNASYGNWTSNCLNDVEIIERGSFLFGRIVYIFAQNMKKMRSIECERAIAHRGLKMGVRSMTT